MNCTLCNTPLKHQADEYYFICATCGAYVKNEKYYISGQQEKAFYDTHNNDVHDVRYQHFTSPITNEILKHFDTVHLGLDYGCGTGPVISKQLLDKGFKVKLYDPFFYPDDDYLKFKYDYIFSCEVFEHFYQAKQEIEKLLSLIKHNGKLLIMTHLYDNRSSFNDWYYRKDPTHVFIYTQATIQYLSQQYNLKIEKQHERLTVFKKLPTAILEL